MFCRRWCLRVASDTFDKYDLRNRNMDAENLRRSHTPLGRLRVASDTFDKHDLRNRNMGARNRGEVTPPWGGVTYSSRRNWVLLTG